MLWVGWSHPWPVEAAHQAYGAHFFRLEQTRTRESGGEPAAANSPFAREIDAYRGQMETLEDIGGPYTDGLIEPLAAAGRYYRARQEYPAAIAAFGRAVHIVRVNEGLYSQSQLPLVRELLRTLRAAGEFEALDHSYDYFFRLYGRGRPPFTAVRTRASLEYLRWQREALQLELDGGGRGRLLELIELNGELLETANADADVPYEYQRDLTHSQLRNLYILQYRFTPRRQEPAVGVPGGPMGAWPPVAEFEDNRMENQLRGAAAKGVGLLRQLQSRAAEQGVVEMARAELALGDWYWWNGRRSSAIAAYESVVATLAGAGETERLARWLGDPVELPAGGIFPPLETIGQRSVRATFDVSDRGRVGNVQARSLGLTTEQELSDFRRRLRGTLFRPRWAAGRAEAVTALQRDYQLVDQEQSKK